ncbi:Multisite-specific tRNA:(cytosine-C(5))-methyltransferase trm4b [Teratosphaeria destructans]|uniref:NOL1/NOP2/Sun domain family member 4 n=1 Tax=Teratosphaeria destructans TaxID=418781 RepID=A0A9W7VYW5_9PEZI|nr:Multisite-specific tRNA:(cytosine-C(5))-methyltransferase trm4b [Teratosphaeria destructans]
MTKTTRNSAPAIEEAFHRHYAAIWGKERWHQSLYPALAEPTRYAALVNGYADFEHFWKAIDEAEIPRDELTELQFPRHRPDSQASSDTDVAKAVTNNSLVARGIRCFARATTENSPSCQAFPPPKAFGSDPAKLLAHWNLDAASALAASLLDIKPGDAVLDLCAAPGGKSVTLSQNLFPSYHATHSGLDAVELAGDEATGRLVSNEADGRRQKRLAENLRDYIPPQFLKTGYIKCTNVDGTSASASALAAGKGGYDKVLVDAPCSSERHIIHAHLKARATGGSAPEMTNWRPGSSKRLAEIQTKLLMTALKAVKLGGSVMYATCSIEGLENDGVVERMVREVAKERKKGVIRWDITVGFGDGLDGKMAQEALEGWAERTRHGWIVLPDHPRKGKWGPLYFAMIKKVGA